MSANWTNEQLNDYIDNRLTPDQRAELDSAIGADPSARQALDDLEIIRSLVRNAPRLKPRKSLVPVVEQAIRNQALQGNSTGEPVCPARVLQPTTYGGLEFRTAAAAVASLAACLLLVLFLAPSPAQNTAQVAENPLQNNVDEPDTESVIPELPSAPDATAHAGDSLKEQPGVFEIGHGSVAAVFDTDALTDSLARTESPEEPSSSIFGPSAPVNPEAQTAATTNPADGNLSRFDEVILIRTNRSSIDSAFRLLALTPVSRHAPPDSVHSPDAGIVTRQGDRVLEDKSSRQENKPDSETTPVPGSPDVSGDKSGPAIMSHYVSVDATQSELDDLLGQVNAEVDRLPLVQHLLKPSSQELVGDEKAMTTGEDKTSGKSAPSGVALFARKFSPEGSFVEPDQLPRMPGQKRFLLIFVESISPAAPGSDSR